MVTILGILCNSLWISGLAGVIATISYTHWSRQRLHPSSTSGKTMEVSWKEAMQQAAFVKPLSVSMFLTSLGIGASGWQARPASPMWQTVLWLVLALLFATQFFAYFKQK